MVKILTFGNSNEKEGKYEENFFKSLWVYYKSLDRFLRLQILVLLLIIIATPAITASYLIINSHAASNYIVDSSIVSELNQINSYRRSNGLSTLTPTYTLTQAAKWKAQDMAAKSYMSHYDSTCLTTSCATTYNNRCQGISTCGRFFEALQRAYGYTFNTYRSEILGWTNYSSGIDDSSYILQLWQASAPHKAALLTSVYTAVGIYRAYNPGGHWYWAVEFGSYIDSPVTYVTSAPTPVNGVCSATHYNCAAGTSVNNVNGTASYTWTCNGSNGGANKLCAELKTAIPTPSWTFCNVENATCVFPGTRQVRFGANGSYLTKTLTNSTPCTRTAFGSDPISGIVKHCEFNTSTLPTTWSFHIGANAVAKMYTLGTGGCMSSYATKTWGSSSSSAPANKPVVRTYCGSTQNGVTVYIPSGAFAGKNVRILPADGTSLTHN